MTLGYLRLDGWRGVIGSFVIWAIYFLVIYAFLSVGCEKGSPEAELYGVNVLTLALVAITVSTLALIAAVGLTGVVRWRAAADDDRNEQATDQIQNRFTALLGMMASGLALLSTIWVGFPVLLLQPCQ